MLIILKNLKDSDSGFQYNPPNIMLNRKLKQIIPLCPVYGALPCGGSRLDNVRPLSLNAALVIIAVKGELKIKICKIVEQSEMVLFSIDLAGRTVRFGLSDTAVWIEKERMRLIGRRSGASRSGGGQ